MAALSLMVKNRRKIEKNDDKKEETIGKSEFSAAYYTAVQTQVFVFRKKSNKSIDYDRI